MRDPIIIRSEPKGKRISPKVEIRESGRELTSHSGLYLVEQFVEALGVREEIDRSIRAKQRDRGYDESQSILSLAYSMIAGGDCLEDVDHMRNDETLLRLLGEEQLPHSTTTGDFLRRFSLGHIRQFEKSMGHLVKRVYKNDLTRKVTLDMDSSVFEMHSKKEGTDWAYNKKYGYHPLFCFIAENGDWLHMRLRRGSAYTTRGAESFLSECLRRLPVGLRVKLRGDSGFYKKGFVEECERRGIQFTITADQTAPLLETITQMGEDEWTKCEEGWEVAEFRYRPVKWRKEYRYIVKRVEMSKGEQTDIFHGTYRYHVCVTNYTSGSAYLLMKFHMRRGSMENYLKEIKDGFSLRKLPTDRFHANWTYLLIGMLAYNLISWMKRLVLPRGYRNSLIKKIRFRFIQIGGLLIRTGRRYILDLQKGYFHLKEFVWIYERIRELDFAGDG